VNSKRLLSLGLAAVLSLAIALPAFAQGNENRDYQAIQDERDQRKQREMLEKFINNYPNSAHRPDYDLQLMALYYGNKDWQLMIRHADNFALTQGTADPEKKSSLFTLAMEASRQLKNDSKFNEFSEKALAANPNNLSVLLTLSRGLAENPPAEKEAKAAAMDKALGYAEKAKNVPKSAKITDAEWTSTQARVQGIIGMIYFNLEKWPEAGTAFAEYLKVNPTDGLHQYRYGICVYRQLQQTLANLQQLNSDAKLAQAAGDNDRLSAYIDRLNLRTKEFETQRDLTIDAMAKAHAIGGPFADSAKEILKPLFNQKTGSLEGIDPFIASKKAELAALTPLPTPAFGGARGASGMPPGGAPATGR
jgi:hypothetical protein